MSSSSFGNLLEALPTEGGGSGVTETASTIAAADLFPDIRQQGAAGGANAKFAHERVVLSAVEEVLESQGLQPTAISYMGGLMMSLQTPTTQPSLLGAALVLLERALAGVPPHLLCSKRARIAEVLVSVSNENSDQAAVLRPALLCVKRLLIARPNGATSTAAAKRGNVPGDVLKLFRWVIQFVRHQNPKVRQRGQAVCIELLHSEALPVGWLSPAVARFAEQKLGAITLSEAQSALHLLHFLRGALPELLPEDASALVAAMLKLPQLGHPLLSKSALELLTAAAAGHGGGAPLPPKALIQIQNALLGFLSDVEQAGGGGLKARARRDAALVPSAARAAVAAAVALCTQRAIEGERQLAALVGALLRALNRQALAGVETAAAAAERAGMKPSEPLGADDLLELLNGCATSKLSAQTATAIAEVFALPPPLPPNSLFVTPTPYPLLSILHPHIRLILTPRPPNPTPPNPTAP